MAGRALLIDLDDTLYEERAYVMSGFNHVARAVEREYGVPATEAVRFLERGLTRDGRGKLFDSLLSAHGIEPAPDLVRGLVAEYRAHVPDIVLEDTVRETLATLRTSYLLALVTDGLAEMQRNKVAALDLPGSVDQIIYCWEEGCPKPSARGFELALERLGASGVAVIGDNVAHDLPAAVELRLPFIRVRRGRFADVPNPPTPVEVVDVATFAEVPAALDAVQRCG